MAKRILCVLLVWALFLIGFSAAAEGEELTLLVSSDLHFTLYPDSAIYPMMNRIEALCHVLADEVIEAHPDAFVLCGDNTNSGRPSDAEALAAILRQIRAAGIPVIIVPGNHDFDLGDEESFKAAYKDLCEVEDQDPASLSYMLHLGSFCVLAMDDSSSTHGARGAFSADTMRWLQKQLENAARKNEPVLFLSHHNVLPGGETAEDSSYMIQNPELRDLLAEFGVRLCLSGHRHSQEILSHCGIYEIVSAMPAIPPHLIGRIHVQNGKLNYQAEPIDWEAFGAEYELKDVLSQEKDGAGTYQTVLSSLPDWELQSQEEREAVSRLFRLFMENYGNGSLADVREEILGDPFCDLYLDLFAGSNYGPWMRYLLENSLHAGNRLELDYTDILT